MRYQKALNSPLSGCGRVPGLKELVAARSGGVPFLGAAGNWGGLPGGLPGLWGGLAKGGVIELALGGTKEGWAPNSR